MKTIQQLLLCLGLCFFLNLSFAQNGFEGKITMTIKGIAEVHSSTMQPEDGEPTTTRFSETKKTKSTIVIYTNGLKSRLEIQDLAANSKTYIISDNEKGDFYIFSDKNKGQAVRMNRNDPMFIKMTEKMITKNRTNKNISLKETTQTKELSGYNCKKYIATSENGDGELWITRDFNFDIMTFAAFFGENPILKEASKDFGEGEGFIMEMRGKDSNGHLIEITKTVEREQLDDNLFTVGGKDGNTKVTDIAAMQAIVQEYSKKMREANGDTERIKALSEEMNRKIKALQNQ